MNWPIPFTPQHWEVGNIYRTLQVRKQRLKELPSTLLPCPRSTTQPASVLWVSETSSPAPTCRGHILCPWASQWLVSHLIWAEGCSLLLPLGSRVKASQQLLSNHYANLFPSPLSVFIFSAWGYKWRVPCAPTATAKMPSRWSFSPSFGVWCLWRLGSTQGSIQGQSVLLLLLSHFSRVRLCATP